MSRRATIAAVFVVLALILLLMPRDDAPEPGGDAIVVGGAGTDPLNPGVPPVGSQPGARDGVVSRNVIDPVPATTGCSTELLESALYGGESPADAMRRRGEALFPVLSSSNDAELVLAAVMLGSFAAPEDTIAAMERALALSPKHPLVLWQAARYCAGDSSYPFCSGNARPTNADAVLGHNGAYWSLVAAGLVSAGDADGALDALKRGVSAPEFHYYFVQRVVLLERALASSSDLPYRGRVYEAMAILAREDPYWFMAGVCRQRSQTEDDWRNACAGYADRLVADSRMLLPRRIGMELHRSNESRSNDEPGVPTFMVDEHSMDADTRRLFDYGEGTLSLMEQWQLADDGFAAAFMDEMAASGEVAAYLSAAEEAIRRREAGQSNPCEFAGVELP